jgi:3-phenylpropionate/cinnamic acid dioxygenase small subunit
VTADPTRQIENLIFRYAELIDAGDFDGMADLLAQATLGSLDDDGGLQGRDAIARLFHATTLRHEDGTPRTKHVTTNVIVEVGEDATTATARSYFTVFQALPGLALQPIVAGRYRDRFGLGPGGWAFTERRFGVDLIGDVSRHLSDGGLGGAHPS